MTDDKADFIAEGVRKRLQGHGLPFQQAVLMAVHGSGLRAFPSPHWEPAVMEFPAKPPNFTSTHIDLILQGRGFPVWMVVECKRAVPSRANWCFIKASFMGKNVYETNFYVETITHEKGSNDTTADGGTLPVGHVPFSTGFVAVGNANKNDFPEEAENDKPLRKYEDDFKSACKQLSQGVNGLVTQLARQPSPMTYATLGLLPVLVTTAPLFLVEGTNNIEAITDGNLPPGSLRAAEVPLVCYQNVQSSDLRHDVPSGRPSSSCDLGMLLCQEYLRTIVVINANHWSEFLRSWEFQGVRFGKL